MNKLTKILITSGVLTALVTGVIIVSNMQQKEPVQAYKSIVTVGAEPIVNDEAVKNLEDVNPIEIDEKNVDTTTEPIVVTEDKLSKEMIISYIETTYSENIPKLIITFLAGEHIFTKDNYKQLLGGMDTFLSNPDNRFTSMDNKLKELNRLANL